MNDANDKHDVSFEEVIHNAFEDNVLDGSAMDLGEWRADFGTPRHSGRYPWGSGDHPYQRNASFLGNIDKLKKRGLSETEIAKSMNMKTSEFRKRRSLALAENRAYLESEARKLLAKGMSKSAIGRRLGMNESTVRSLLDDDISQRMNRTAKNSKVLMDAVERKSFIDISKGVEHYMGLSKTSFDNAVKILEERGYTVHKVQVEQVGTGKPTTMKILCPPGTEWTEAARAAKESRVKMVQDTYSEDGGDTIRQFEPPRSIKSNRIMVRYAEDGGTEKDGVLELRPNVEDISLNKARYAQVRVAVDGTHYLKGMAIYGDPKDFPPGVDIIFNTNKHNTVPMINKKDPDHSVLKPMKRNKDGEIDISNPFGANIRDDDKLLRAQRHYFDKNGKEQLSALNIVSEEGTWREWNKTLASQFLSKQPPALAKRQLKLLRDRAENEYEDIMALNNPTVRAKLLDDFAGRCESDAVHLQAAAMPRQATAVILPIESLKDTEVYAPKYKDGEHIALIRYPHAGGFEIPILTVNNSNREGKKVLGDPLDAVGISKTVADRLSGADFDGDTVITFPVDNVKITASANKRSKDFQSLEGFDQRELFPKYDGMHVMTKHEHGIEMGKITNLITDMTFQGATEEEICRAVKHSMVVVDANKHELDYRRSEREFDIQSLRDRYQDGGGASTLLSRSTAEYKIPQRKEKSFSKMSADEKKRYFQGERIWEDTYSTKRMGKPDKSQLTKEEKHILNGGTASEKKKLRERMTRDGLKESDLTDDERHILNGGTNLEKRDLRTKLYNEGRMVYLDELRLQTTTRGYEKDPYELVSRDPEGNTTKIESIYADHAREMKNMAKRALATSRAQIDISYDPKAAKLYSKEVKDLNEKLKRAEMNAPLERQAQMIANCKLASIFYNNPDMDAEHRKREKGIQLEAARKLVGAGKKLIGTKDNELTEREWEAISKGAITPSKLKSILKNADSARIRELSMPKDKPAISSAKLSRAKAMLRNGHTRAEVAEALDISESTLVRQLKL